MNEAQLTLWANMIVSAMKAGNMDQMNDVYNKFSEKASMEDAAQLEGLIAKLSG